MKATTKQLESLQKYEGHLKDRMIKVINAIADCRLIYIKFLDDGSGATFYYRDKGDYYLTTFDINQTNVILMSNKIDKHSFGL